MPAPVTIDFQVGGIRDVLRAFDTLESRMERAEKTGVAGAQAGANTRTEATKKETAFRGASFEKLVEKIAKLEKELTAKTEAETARRNAFYSKDDAERLAKAKKSASERERLAEQEAKTELGVWRHSVESFKKAADEKTAIAKREAKARESIAENEAMNELRILRHSLEQQKRAAEQAANEQRHANERAARSQTQVANREAAFNRRMTMRMGRSIGDEVVGSISSTAGSIGMMAAGAVGIGGGFAVAGALRDEMSFETAVAQASNEAYDPNDKTGKRSREATSTAKIAAMALQTQSATNIDKTAIAHALQSYVGKSSDVEGLLSVNPETGMTNMEELARMAKATGGDVGTYVTASASLKKTSPNMSTADMMNNMLMMYGAGKKGTLPIEEMAPQLPTIVANASMYSGDRTENQRKLIGLSQIVGGYTKDAAVAAEGVSRYAESIARQGMKNGMTPEMIFTDKSHTTLLAPEQLIPNVFAATKGDIPSLEKIMGREGFRVAQAFQGTYSAAGGGQAGKEAIAAQIIAANVTTTHQDIKEESDKVMATSGEKLAKTMLDLKEMIATAAMPAFNEFAQLLVAHKDDIAAVFNGLAKLAKAFMDYPMASILMVFAGKLTSDLVSRTIAETVEQGILKIFRQAAFAQFPSLAAGGGGALSGALGGGGTALAGGAVAGEMGGLAIAGQIAAGVIAGGVVVAAIAAVGIAMKELIDYLKDKADQADKDKASVDLNEAGMIAGNTAYDKNGNPVQVSDAARKQALLAFEAKEEAIERRQEGAHARAEGEQKAYGYVTDQTKKDVQDFDRAHRNIESILAVLQQIAGQHTTSYTVGDGSFLMPQPGEPGFKPKNG